MEILKLILENPEATVQIIGAVVLAITSIIGSFSVIIKLWTKKPKSKIGREIKSAVNKCALNKPLGEGDK